MENLSMWHVYFKYIRYLSNNHVCVFFFTNVHILFCYAVNKKHIQKNRTVYPVSWFLYKKIFALLFLKKYFFLPRRSSYFSLSSFNSFHLTSPCSADGKKKRKKNEKSLQFFPHNIISLLTFSSKLDDVETKLDAEAWGEEKFFFFFSMMVADGCVWGGDGGGGRMWHALSSLWLILNLVFFSWLNRCRGRK